MGSSHLQHSHVHLKKLAVFLQLLYPFFKRVGISFILVVCDPMMKRDKTYQNYMKT